MKNLLLAISAIAFFVSAQTASAATRVIDFSFGPMTHASAGPVFGVGIGDSISGSFSFDDTGLALSTTSDLLPAMTGLSLTTGTKSWELSDVFAGTINLNALGAVTQFDFQFQDADGDGYAYSNNTFAVRTSPTEVAFCNGCSDFTEVAVATVPLPAGISLGILALGSIGFVGRRRKTA